MTQKLKNIYSIAFAFVIIIANYTVQFPINDWLTYGALLFPVTFLLTDILSEKYSKEDIRDVLKYAIILAIIPTILIAGWRIAFASIFTFYVVQQLDVRIFQYIKQKYNKQWWLRNNVSTMISSFLDTSLFFLIAFSFVMPIDVIAKLIIGDYLIKVSVAILDTPLFYIFAIRVKQMAFKK